jgi:hypothetical protein
MYVPCGMVFKRRSTKLLLSISEANNSCLNNVRADCVAEKFGPSTDRAHKHFAVPLHQNTSLSLPAVIVTLFDILSAWKWSGAEKPPTPARNFHL